MLKNPDLSEFSLLSSKKPYPSSSKRNRSDFEKDYTQEIMKNPLKPVSEASRIPSKANKTILQVQKPFELKDPKIMDSQITLPSNKIAGIEEVKKRWMSKSDQLYRCRRISEKIDNYLEHDEIFADAKSLKDETSGAKNIYDEYESFDSHFYFFNSFPLPNVFYQLYEENSETENKILKGVLPEINCVYLIIGRTLQLWRYVNDFSNKEDINIGSIYSLEENSNQKQVFSFGPYEEIIHAVNVCRPNANILLQYDIKYLFIIGFDSNIKLFNLVMDDQGIDLEFLEISIKVEKNIGMISCSQTARMFYGCSNGKIKEIIYKETKSFGFIPLRKGGFYSKNCKKSIKSHIFDCLSSYSIFGSQKLLKMISIDDTRYVLYALLEVNKLRSEVVVYDLGSKNDSFEKLFSINESSLRTKLLQTQKVDLDENDLKIVYISALSLIHSKDIHLMLMTKNGLRIFLTFFTYISHEIEPHLSSYMSSERLSPEFEISFVKYPIILSHKRNFSNTGLIPEKNQTLASTQQTRRMICGFMDKNTCFMIDSNENVEKDDVSLKFIYFFSQNLSKIGLSHEIYQNKKRIEDAGTIKIRSDKMVDDIEICQIPINSLASSTVFQLQNCKINGSLMNKQFYQGGKTGSLSFNCLNDLCKQVYFPANHYLFLTGSSLDFVIKARPIDFLFQIISNSTEDHRIDEYQFNKFVNFYGGIETCCMLLQIICNKEMYYYFNETLDHKLKEGYFIRINQNLQEDQLESTNNRQIIRCRKANEEIIFNAINEFFKLGDALPQQEEKTQERRDYFEGFGKLIEPDKKTYTYKIEGFLLYFSRLIRPIWNKTIFNQNVYDNLIYEKLENFREDELQLVRIRILEIKNFMDAKNERFLIRHPEIYPDSHSGNPNGHNSRDHLNIMNLKSKTSSQKGNVEEILWDEKIFLEDFYQFLERTVQTIDMMIFLIASHNLRPIINMMTTNERGHLLSLPFHALFREIHSESPMKSLLSAYMKKNFRDHKTISTYFLDNYSLYFTEPDSKAAEAEQYLELAFKLPIENVNEKNKFFSKGMILLHDNISEISEEYLSSIYSNYLEKCGMFLESIVLVVKYLNNLTILEQELKVTRSQNIDKHQILYDKLEYYHKNTQQNKEATRNLAQKILMKIFFSINYATNKGIIPDFTKNNEEIQVIKNLQLPELNDLFDKCLKEIFKSYDEILQKNVISWLFNQKLFENILNIDSKVVEEVLLNENEQKFKEKYLTLYKFYVNKGQHIKAYRLAVKISLHDQSETIAIDGNLKNEYMKDFIIPEEEVITISERLKFMNFAIQELENYLMSSDQPHDKDHVKYSEKKSDLILKHKQLQIQSKVIDELHEINEETKESLAFYTRTKNNEDICQILMREKNEIEFIISYLNRKIVDLEELKSNFMEKYGMFACKLFLYDYAENKLSMENVYQIYEIIITHLFKNTFQTNLWESAVKKKLKFIYFNLTTKRKTLFPLKQIIFLLENLNQIHPAFSQYQDNIDRYFNENQQATKEFPSPFWIPEFLSSDLNIKTLEFLTIYEDYFNLSLNKYEKELENVDSEGICHEINRNIENFIYALHLLVHVIELSINSIQKNLKTVISEVASKHVLQDCHSNIRDFIEKQPQIEALLFECFEKLNLLKKHKHMDEKMINIIELFIKSLSESIKKINQQMNLLPIGSEVEPEEIEEIEQNNKVLLSFSRLLPESETIDSTERMKIKEFQHKNISNFIDGKQESPKNLNGKSHENGGVFLEKKKKISKYDFTKTPI